MMSPHVLTGAAGLQGGWVYEQAHHAPLPCCVAAALRNEVSGGSVLDCTRRPSTSTSSSYTRTAAPEALSLAQVHHRSMATHSVLARMQCGGRQDQNTSC